jgi:hypothetical protein
MDPPLVVLSTMDIPYLHDEPAVESSAIMVTGT